VRKKGKQKTALKDRWPANAAEDVHAWLGKGACQSPFGLTESGLCDLRGLVLHHSPRLIQVNDVDFSYGGMGDGLFVATFSNCRFQESRYECWIGESYTDCDFTKADLRHCTLGGAFDRCDFTGANFGTVRGSKVQFNECKFVNTKLRSTSFSKSVFKNCLFQESVYWHGSLGNSQFVDCKFRDFQFDDVVVMGVKGIDFPPGDVASLTFGPGP
jgi:uncharacterized protein YjbI with pentapeptide repeats